MRHFENNSTTGNPVEVLIELCGSLSDRVFKGESWCKSSIGDLQIHRPSLSFLSFTGWRAPRGQGVDTGDQSNIVTFVELQGTSGTVLQAIDHRAHCRKLSKAGAIVEAKRQALTAEDMSNPDQLAHRQPSPVEHPAGLRQNEPPMHRTQMEVGQADPSHEVSIERP
jgi:hypothetical protein